MQRHVQNVLNELRILSGAVPPRDLQASHWSPELYAALGAHPDGPTLESVLALSRWARMEMVLPYSEHANTTPRERPTDDKLVELLTRLQERWPMLIGATLAGVTKPIAFSGRKKRRLVVLADPNASPPCGTWQALAEAPARSAFTSFRAAINRALAPHEVDHVDFIVRAPE